MVRTWAASLFAKPKAEDVAGTCSVNNPDRPDDEETNEASVVQVGRGLGADGSKQAAGGGGGFADDVDARQAQDVKIDIAVAADQEAAPSTSRAGLSQGGRRADGRPRQHGRGPAGIGNDGLWRFWHLLLRRLTNAGAALLAHLSRIFTCSWVGSGGSAGDEQRRKRLREFAKKAIPLDSVLFLTLSAHKSPYSTNTFFGMSMAVCLLAFFADLLSAVCLINSSDFAVEWHCFLACVSSVSMILMPYLLLVSFNKLSAYALLAVPLPVAAALLHRACSGALAVPISADTLDHIFDVSSAVNTIAAGGGLM